jgi:hypothetical protein
MRVPSKEILPHQLRYMLQLTRVQFRFSKAFFNWSQTGDYHPIELPISSGRVRNTSCHCGISGHFLGRWGQCPLGNELLPIAQREVAKIKPVKKSRERVEVAPIPIPAEEVEVRGNFSVLICRDAYY